MRPLRLLAVLTPVLLAAGLLAGGSAHAAAVDGGPIVAGTPVTATFAAVGDTVSYTASVPSDQHLTFTVDPVATTARAAVAYSGVTSGGAPGIGVGAAQFAEVPALFNPTGASSTVTVTLTGAVAGDLVFTPAIVADAAVTPLTVGAAQTATVTVPGARARFTLTLARSTLLGVRASGVSLTPSTVPQPAGPPPPYGPPPQAFTVSIGVPLGASTTLRPSTIPELYTPVRFQAGTYTVTVDPQGESTGSLTLQLYDVVDITAPLTAGVSTTADFATPWTKLAQSLSVPAGGRVRVDVTASTLVHRDGTPGVVYYPFASAPATVRRAISDQPTSFETDTLTGPFTLTMEPDGLTTGTLTFTVTVLAPTDLGTLALDTPTTTTLVAPGQNLAYTVPVESGARYSLTVTGASLTAATGPASAVVTLLPPGALPTIPVTTVTDAVASLAVLSDVGAQPGTYTLVVDPAADTLGSFTVTLHRIGAVVVPLVLGATRTATLGGVGDALAFTYPGGMDTLPVLRVSSALTGIDGSPAAAGLLMVQDGVQSTSLGTTSAAVQTLVVPNSFDPQRPWSIGATVPDGSSGSVSVELVSPSVTAQSLILGAASTATFSAPGDVTRFTFAVPAGRRIVIRSTATGVTPWMRLTDAAGTPLGAAFAETYHEVDGPSAAGTVRLTVENQQVSRGTVSVAALAVTDPVVAVDGLKTVSWTIGQNPHLTFKGVKGAHALLDVRSLSWTLHGVPGSGGFGPPAVLGPDGSIVGYLPQVVTGSAGLYELPQLLPATGVYTIVVDPFDAAVGTVRAQARVVTDLQRTVRLGSPVDVEIDTPGQNAVLGVVVPGGAQLSWQAVGSTFGEASLRLVDANGSWLSSMQLLPGSSASSFFAGPLAPGTYRVVVDPVGSAVGKVRLTLTAG